MTCEKCGRGFALVTGGMGDSDRPGYYFRVGVAFLLVFLVLLALRLFIGAAVVSLFVFIMIGWAFVAIGDVRSSECPGCKHRNKVKAWSV